ncbi:transcriptional regulator [Streptomyces sp. NA04227]|uniref:helix-turn-helix domain-containing protein n=1 Tax=Streptomyces sp. NA04227 TaxID=2742136 RepID=UPI0015926344|nr:helix-turn-helix domain-containing protein [Streptomyces sp. NA04227]QKW05923.1 transcriptional regulator [Streptomyces sp. NA04227]
MYDVETRARAMALVHAGSSLSSVSRQTGISRSTLRAWMSDSSIRLRNALPCPRCRTSPGLPDDGAAYTYLLGLYLGDGHISEHRRGVTALRVICGNAWPGLIERCAAAIRAVRPDNRVCLVRRDGCVAVTSYSKHWPCLFPQHGPGKKHDREIRLEQWQRALVAAHPWELVRGLVHSDGCRITNWTEREVGGVRKRYEYPRYFFTNKSADIMRLFTDTLDALGVEWKSLRQTRHAPTVSVARKGSVALMDTHIGPKY